jgi:hypothetical protein
VRTARTIRTALAALWEIPVDALVQRVTDLYLEAHPPTRPDRHPVNGRGATQNHRHPKAPDQYVNAISPAFGFGAMNRNLRKCPECDCAFEWVQEGPGRPPKFCSNRCRHEARRRTIRESTRRWREKQDAS